MDYWYPPERVPPWDEYVALARQYVQSGRLDPEEIDYKREVGALSAAAGASPRQNPGLVYYHERRRLDLGVRIRVGPRA